MGERNAGGRAPRAVLDALIVVSLVCSVFAVVSVRRSLTATDAAATELAHWATERGATRVAWPMEERRAVPALVEAGIRPVLVEAPDPPPQGYAIEATPVVVTMSGAAAPPFVIASHSAGSLTAHEIDLAKAAEVPLAVGDVVGQSFSRPYRYAPILPSLALGAKPYMVPLRLAPGTYRVTVEAMSPTLGAMLRVAVSIDGDHQEDVFRLRKTVDPPVRFTFEVPAGGAEDAVLTLANASDQAARPVAVFAHAWTLSRLAAP